VQHAVVGAEEERECRVIEVGVGVDDIAKPQLALSQVSVAWAFQSLIATQPAQDVPLLGRVCPEGAFLSVSERVQSERVCRMVRDLGHQGCS
jgi:hypothetical protein